MRKITHIELGKKLSKNVKDDYLKYKSFIFGNIFPDCVPTFIYIRHNIKSTFNKLEKLLNEIFVLDINTHKFWIKLGCIIHYISDYFTYPHTKIFNGGFFIHNKYEKDLKNNFIKYLDINNHNIKQNFKNIKDILLYIKQEQENYFIIKKEDKSIIVDVYYIGKVCQIVFENIISYKINDCFCC